MQVYVVTEKRGLVAPMRSWLDEQGIPIVPLGGYTSQTLCDEVARRAHGDARPVVLLIAADYDPSGWFLPTDFTRRARLDGVARVERVGLTHEQVEELGLPTNPAPSKDPRLASFIRETGTSIQVELNTVVRSGHLERWLCSAVARWWDDDAFRRDLEREREQAAELGAWIERGRP